MADPNIISVTSIYGRTATATLTTTTSTSILSCPVNKVLKINTIIVCNRNGANSSDAYVGFHDSSRTSTVYLAYTIPVLPDSSLVVVGKDTPIYLQENDQIRAGSSTTNDLDIIISYEEITA